MKPFEADCYVEGWDARIADKLRSDNPYQPPYAHAWDSYRRDAWDRGWFHCDRGEAFVDPRPKPKRTDMQGAR